MPWILPYAGAGLLGLGGYVAGLWTSSTSPDTQVNVAYDGVNQESINYGWLAVMSAIPVLVAFALLYFIRWVRQ